MIIILARSLVCLIIVVPFLTPLYSDRKPNVIIKIGLSVHLSTVNDRMYGFAEILFFHCATTSKYGSRKRPKLSRFFYRGFLRKADPIVEVFRKVDPVVEVSFGKLIRLSRFLSGSWSDCRRSSGKLIRMSRFFGGCFFRKADPFAEVFFRKADSDL